MVIVEYFNGDKWRKLKEVDGTLDDLPDISWEIPLDWQPVKLMKTKGGKVRHSKKAQPLFWVRLRENG